MFDLDRFIEDCRAVVRGDSSRKAAATCWREPIWTLPRSSP